MQNQPAYGHRAVSLARSCASDLFQTRDTLRLSRNEERIFQASPEKRFLQKAFSHGNTRRFTPNCRAYMLSASSSSSWRIRKLDGGTGRVRSDDSRAAAGNVSMLINMVIHRSRDHVWKIRSSSGGIRWGKPRPTDRPILGSARRTELHSVLVRATNNFRPIRLKWIRLNGDSMATATLCGSHGHVPGIIRCRSRDVADADARIFRERSCDCEHRSSSRPFSP